MIFVYAQNETEYRSNGLGAVTDAISCEVEETRNGLFELELRYPVTGRRYRDLQESRLLLTPAWPGGSPQPFEITERSAEMGGIVTYRAQHFSYRLASKAVLPFTAQSAAEAMAKLEANALEPTGFTFWTDVDTAGSMALTHPESIRNVLGGVEGSILQSFGGEYEFDGLTVKLHKNRGRDRGVTIRYGKNLTDIRQERNIRNIYSEVLPYWQGMDGVTITLPERVVPAPGEYTQRRTLVLDLSADFEEKPTEEQLRSLTRQRITAGHIGLPAVNLRISFVDLSQTAEYAEYQLLERVLLCDTVSVYFPPLGVDVAAKVIRTRYDALRDRYISVELGSQRSTLASTVVGQGQDIHKIQSPSYQQQMADRATGWITNGGGYMVAVRDAAGNWREICSLDTPNLDTAVNVWRWNNGGFGHSKNGYAGPYETAITQDGHIVANFITVGSMSASMIRGGLLISQNGNLIFNLDAGRLEYKSAMGVQISDEAIQVDRPGTEMANRIDNTGMHVERSGTPMLTATAAGVKARDLQAENYLIIGENSRLEDYTDEAGRQRTACFAI